MKVVLVGLPGAGKSTLLDFLAARGSFKNARYISEPVEKWMREGKGEIGLRDVWRDPQRFECPFQLTVFNHMLARDLLTDRRGWVFCERDSYSSSVIFTRAFEQQGAVSWAFVDILDRLLELCKCERGDFYVYLKLPPMKALERIEKRNRPGEWQFYRKNGGHFLRVLSKLHNQFFDKSSGNIWLDATLPTATQAGVLIRELDKRINVEGAAVSSREDGV